MPLYQTYKQYWRNLVIKSLIQKGNTKLPSAYMFNLPAGKEICNRTCSGCYAIKEQIRYPNVVAARNERYQAALQPDFSRRVIAELQALKRKPKYFRIHSSGDFFSQLYLNDWTRIATAVPEIIFYAYTKRSKDFDFSQFKSLPNTVLINSFHYGGLNYGKLDKAPPEAFICPHVKGSTIECLVDCTYCVTKQAEIVAPYFQQH
jgi:sulfatase maturation enzyme AslB (radical SAM superfamily)